MSKPLASVPKGTRDFGPEVMVKRNYIFDTIRSVFVQFGYQEIQTPSMENLSTLMGKYGEEGDRLIFKILNSGDAIKKADKNAIENNELVKFTNSISDKALRYDLTVPFARYVVQHRNDISFPFKRFQIQPVWRADRPQKGRYREFYQCDADVVGSYSLLYEIEYVQIFDQVLSSLKIPDFSIKINNRKILSGIAEISGQADKLIDITTAIDKLDKIGKDKVFEELADRGLTEISIEKIKPLFELTGTNQDQLELLKGLLKESEIGLKGIEEIQFIFDQLDHLGLKKAKVEFDVTLARGLNYYTGAIFEVKANGVSIGSICGGGRYDDLTGIFGLKDVAGVGISFGADRIYDVLNELNLFPTSTQKGCDVMVANLDESLTLEYLKISSELRNEGLSVELYPSASKFNKQMKFANQRNVSFVVLLGSNEHENNEVSIKHMETGDQHTVKRSELVSHLSILVNKDYSGLKKL